VPVWQYIQLLTPKFPTKRNTKFFDTHQEKSFEEQGIFVLISGTVVGLGRGPRVIRGQDDLHRLGILAADEFLPGRSRDSRK